VPLGTVHPSFISHIVPKGTMDFDKMGVLVFIILPTYSP